MRIDNSRAKMWHKCPMAYQHRYKKNREKDWEKITGKPPAHRYGSRMHELLECHYLTTIGKKKYCTVPFDAPEFRNEVEMVTGVKAENVVVREGYPPAPAIIEDEAQLMFEMYRARYPVEPFEVLEVERVFEVPLCDEFPCQGGCSGHTYTGKIDLIVRDKASGLLRILDHKTQKRNAKSNLPGVWTARAQASLYMWVAERLMGEKIDCFILNLLTRQSDAGNCPPEFPDRQHIQRTPEQQEEAIRNIIWTADQIERMEKEFGDKPWPQDRDQCQIGNFKCDYYPLDVFGENEFTLAEFKEAEEYL